MELKKVNANTWDIPKQGGMKVPGRIFASEKLLEAIKQDQTLQQAVNVAHLKGILKYSFVQSDAHQGYGFPIGGVAAMDVEEGVISPGGIGYDIGCGVRLIKTNWTADEIKPHIKELLEKLYKEVPSGVGKPGVTELSNDELQEVLARGAQWAVGQGYGKKADLEHTEEYGSMEADPSLVSARALKRGRPQLGTLGAGNHFLEIQEIEKVHDNKTAAAFKLDNEGYVTIMIHCGSRGLGHQVASEYIRAMEKKYGYEDLPDRELINAPIQSDLGQEYYKAMCAALNYSFANRQMIMHWVREVFADVMGNHHDMDLVYDVCHNTAKFETHDVDGEKRNVCVHRKGSTRSFGPEREEVPEAYRHIGQPVFIPGSMATGSYVLVGTKKSEEISFGSTAHGAGRLLSRSKSIKKFNGESVAKEMEKQGIHVKAASWKGIAEEAAPAYKDIDEVAKVSHELELAKRVARLKPLGVVKG